VLSVSPELARSPALVEAATACVKHPDQFNAAAFQALFRNKCGDAGCGRPCPATFAPCGQCTTGYRGASFLIVNPVRSERGKECYGS
jgi:hypothetical protein